MNNIDEKITAYIEYLKKQGYTVSVHTACIDSIRKLIPYRIHSNPYCLLIKSKKAAWDKCISCQKNVMKKCCDGKPFFGMCYAGVCEYIFPVKKHDKVVGWISVSGYRADEDKAMKRIEKLIEAYGYDERLIKSAYYKWLKNSLPPISEAETLIYPLAAMAELMELDYIGDSLDFSSETNADCIYAHAVLYIESNYREKISVDILSGYCHCSRSYLSHIFKKRSGKSINAFTNEIRLEKSKAILERTNLTMSEIADSLGFSDSSYFTKLFKNYFGISPTKYRIKK